MDAIVFVYVRMYVCMCMCVTNTLLRLSASAPLENCHTWSTSGIMLLPVLSCMLSLRQQTATTPASVGR